MRKDNGAAPFIIISAALITTAIVFFSLDGEPEKNSKPLATAQIPAPKTEMPATEKWELRFINWQDNIDSETKAHFSRTMMEMSRHKITEKMKADFYRNSKRFATEKWRSLGRCYQIINERSKLYVQNLELANPKKNSIRAMITKKSLDHLLSYIDIHNLIAMGDEELEGYSETAYKSTVARIEAQLEAMDYSQN